LTQATTEQDGLPTPQRYWAAATIWLALTLSVLDGSIANVALPTIATDLNAPAADSVWVVNAYQLAIVISLLPMAAVGEMVGFRRVFQLGIIVFSLGSLGCTFAHSLPMLASENAAAGKSIDGLHQAMEWTLLVVIGIHVAAALAHIFVYRDRIMQRMLPE